MLLAQRISLINSIAAFCEASGVMCARWLAIGTDSRIGPKFLNAGPALVAAVSRRTSSIWCISAGISACRRCGLLGGVVVLNTGQQHRIARLVVQKLFGTVTRKADSCFAFKADTNDTREALAIRICRDLRRGAQLAIHDSKVVADQMARDLNLSRTLSWMG